jgi:cysteine-rich repeat protein
MLLGCDECRPKEGYSCVNNTCKPICGDRLVISPELCDYSGTGCVDCRNDRGYECNALENKCTGICGNGEIEEGEGCDNKTAFGCNYETCQALPGFTCEFGRCDSICGDGLTVHKEECDIGNASSSFTDGCEKCLISPSIIIEI